MSDLNKQDATVDLRPEGQIEAVLRQFETAWAKALRGAPSPTLDAYMGLVSDAERLQLLARLQQIDLAYRERLRSERNEATVEVVTQEERTAPARGRPSDEATVEMLSETRQTPPENSGVRGQGSGVRAGSVSDVTLDAPRPTPDLGATVDPVQPYLGATLDPQVPTNLGATLDLDDPLAAESGLWKPAPPDQAAGVNTEEIPPGVTPLPGRQPGVRQASSLASSVPGPTLDPVAAKAFEKGSGEFSLQAGVKLAAASKYPSVQGYEIVGELGRGGMGVVYKARHLRLNRLVALKMVLAGAHADQQQLGRFLAEAEAVAQLQHPSIVQIYEFGHHNDLPYFSLEFVDGGSLQQKINAKPQPIREAAGMMETLALAISFAHQNGIIHRDLKPANVLLTKDGFPKITDFGLAKKLEGDSSQTKSGTLMGTPSYMAPEQARGDVKDIGPLADVYSLGVILYELITGRTPFLGASILDTLQQVRSQEPVPPSRLQPKVPRDLETICLKCLQKDSAKRYASAGDLAADLHRFLTGEPIQARPVGAVEKSWRWCKRNPYKASTIAAAAAVLVVAGIATANTMARAAQDRQTANRAREAADVRLQQATEAVQAGNYRRAQDLLSSPDPQLETIAELADTKARHDELQKQVAAFAEFKELLDNARYYGLFGKGALDKAQDYCRQVVAIYDQIDKRTDKGQYGLPPLDNQQDTLFHEDAFEAFLVAAQVEMALCRGDEAKRETARRALEWFAQAEPLLPPTWIFFKKRSELWHWLDPAKEKQDQERARSIAPTSAVDLFWASFEEHKEAKAAKKDSPLAQEHYERAIRGFARLVEIRPEHFWAYLDCANCLEELGRRNEAIVGLSQCIHIRGDVAWPYFNRGRIHNLLKEYPEAIKDLNTALSLHENYAEARLVRGLAYYHQGKAAEALEDTNRGIELDGNNASAFEQRGEIYRNLLKQYGKAEEDYGRAISVDATFAPAYFDRATLNFERGALAAARRDYSKVIELNPNDATAYERRGTLCLATRDFDTALVDWQTLARLQPRPDAFYYMTCICRGRGQYEAALAAIGQAMALVPNQPRFYGARAQLWHEYGKFPQALADLNLVLTRLDPKDADAFDDRGDLYRALGRFEEAAANYRRSLELNPKEPDSYVGLALAYEKLGKPAQVEECYQKMLAALPKSAAAYLRRAEFRRNQKRFKEALADCAQAAALDPKSLEPPLIRTSVLAARGEAAQAVAEAQKYLGPADYPVFGASTVGLIGCPLGRGPLVTASALFPGRPDTIAHDGPTLYAAACTWSLAAAAVTDKQKASAYQNRAVELLARSREMGIFSLSYQACNRMAEDPALGTIRQDPRVVKLLGNQPSMESKKP
jgi:serine/threonine protein kinase/Flp pilus assembly protein TadD